MDINKHIFNNDQQELARGIATGNQDYFEKVYHLYAKKVYGVARNFFLDHNDAEEMVQEVFFKLWKNRGHIDPDLSLEAYLVTITKNTTLNFLRAKSNRIHYIFEATAGNKLLENNVENTIDYHESLARLNEILDEVSPQRKKVFQMVRLDGMKVDEVANMLKLSRRTVEHHLYHATKLVRSKLSFFVLVLFYCFWAI